MDKVFKKIIEGLEIFDTLYERHESASNSSQKEKLENDLKKEIKKLQRFREQVKNWQAANEIKDKNQLLEHRHLVEVAMEKYKIVEKGSKTKAYSDQSLAAADEPEIDNEAIEFVKQSLETLQQQTESLEAEIERLQPGKKAKKNIHNEELKKELEELLSSHQWHTEKLEIILRLLQNEILSVDDIMNISEDITYYLDENKSPDFMFDDSIYDDLDLEADQTLINDIHVIPDENTSINNNIIPTSTSSNDKDSSPIPEQISRNRSIQPISGTTSRSNSIPNQQISSKSNLNSSLTNNNKSDNHEKPPVIQSIGTSSSNQATVTTLKPAPVPTLTNEIDWSSVVTAAKKKDNSPPPSNSINTNAMNAASVLEALKKQKPKDSPLSVANGTPEPTNGNSTQSEIISKNVEPLLQQQQQQQLQSSQPLQPKDETINKQFNKSSMETSPQIKSKIKTGIISDENDKSLSTPNTTSFISLTKDSSIPIQPSVGFTKSQSLAAATDGFRFLPPGIQSFVLSISSSKDITNSTYNPFTSINHTPNRTYPSGLKAIHLAESWSKINYAVDLPDAISKADDDLLFFGYYYGKSNEERNIALQMLKQKGWKQSKNNLNWYLPRSIVSKGDGWNIGDYSVFNTDKWNVSERRNIKLDNSELII